MHGRSPKPVPQKRSKAFLLIHPERAPLCLVGGGKELVSITVFLFPAFQQKSRSLFQAEAWFSTEFTGHLSSGHTEGDGTE